MSKGGNLLLGIGPNGKGEFEPKVYENLEAFGKWLNVNGEAIYDTHPVEPFSEGQVSYTAKNDRTIYAIYLPAKNEKELPAEISVSTKMPGKPKASLVATRQKLTVQSANGRLNVLIPKNLRASLASQEAVVIKLECQ